MANTVSCRTRWHVILCASPRHLTHPIEDVLGNVCMSPGTSNGTSGITTQKRDYVSAEILKHISADVPSCVFVVILRDITKNIEDNVQMYTCLSGCHMWLRGHPWCLCGCVLQHPVRSLHVVTNASAVTSATMEHVSRRIFSRMSRETSVKTSPHTFVM